jgi:hypothetical protein
MIRLARAAVPALAGLALIAVPATAHAQTYRHTDARKDVVRVTDSADRHRLAPRVQDADITKVRFTHAGSTVTARLSLRKVTDRTNYLVGSLRTPKGRFDVMATVDTGEITLLTGSGRTVACADASVHASKPKDQVTLRIPRSCLGDPRWVRVGVGVVVVKSSAATYFADDALRSRAINDSRLTLSPRVRRG